jgi:stage II sporulation protein AA (anti-sigma F factor antagonist)
MEFHSREEGGVTVVSVSGRLDSVTTPEYEEKIRKLAGQGVTRFVVDATDLQYISSAGLRGLMVTANLAKEKDGKVCLANVTGNVRSVLEMCRLDALFPMEDSVEAAIAAITGS